MKRMIMRVGVVVCAIAVASCAGTPETPASPTATTDIVAAANPDGSLLKATAPSNLSPRDATLDTRRPTLTFNKSEGRFAPAGFAYDLEIQNAAGAIVYPRTIGEIPGTVQQHVIDLELDYETTYWWRVRAVYEGQDGPWSAFAEFRTPNRPAPVIVVPPTASGGGLPFPIPAACGPGGVDNRIACVVAMAALSAEWGSCARGSGLGCHRFTRQVVYALSQFDPNWKLIQAAPGGHACNCNTCGPSDGTMYREDTTVYGGNRVFDMIFGAGGPTPSLGWSPVPGPRDVDRPADAPLCP